MLSDPLARLRLSEGFYFEFCKNIRKITLALPNNIRNIIGVTENEVDQMTDELNTLHPFEESGLGKAPFRCTGWEHRVGPIKLSCGMEVGSPGQPMGTCDFCGNGIAVCMQIVSADGKRFEVGCDCVKKLERKDNKLADAAQRIRAEVRKKHRLALAAKRRAEREREFEAELQKQREANGGLTDREVEERQRELEIAERRRNAEACNGWIIDQLVRAKQTDFVVGMIRELRRGPAKEQLSSNCLHIIADIFAKEITCHARRNTKRFESALESFWSRLES